jgi:hypothetical protein
MLLCAIDLLDRVELACFYPLDGLGPLLSEKIGLADSG